MRGRRISLGSAGVYFRRSTLVFGRSYYRVWISTNRSTDGYEFRNVETAFAQFKLRYERLALPKPLPQLHLRYTGLLSSCDKQLDHPAVEVGAK